MLNRFYKIRHFSTPEQERVETHGRASLRGAFVAKKIVKENDAAEIKIHSHAAGYFFPVYSR
jgi:hypothetical protein